MKVNKCKKLNENNSWEETDGLDQLPLVSYMIIIIIKIVTFTDYM